MNTPDISAIIVTWNGWAYLEVMLRTLNACAASDGVAVEVIVVDNGSTDDTLARLARDFPAAKSIALGQNAGFSVANNRGVEAATAPLVALINNDVEIQGGFFRALIDAAGSHREYDVFAPQMLILRTPSLVDNRGIYLSLAGHHRQRDSRRHRAPEREADEVFGASGGACVIRQSLLERIGLFDEGLGTYLEDADFAERARAAGARCRYVPNAIVLHHGSATASTMPEWKMRMLTRNMAVLRRRWLRPWHLRWWVSRVYVAWQGVAAMRSGRFRLWRESVSAARDVMSHVSGFPARSGTTSPGGDAK